MKKFIAYLLISAILLACVPTAFALGEATALAEAALAASYAHIPVIDRENPLSLDLNLVEPFLYVGMANDAARLFIPDGNAYEYKPSGLPEGAALYVYDGAGLPKLKQGESGARDVFALLFSTGYYNSTAYEGDIDVWDHQYTALFIDCATGEIAARAEGTQHGGGPYVLTGYDYFKDMNGRYVFDRDNGTQLGNIWRDTLRYAAVDAGGAVIENGTLLTVADKSISEYTVPEGVHTIGERAFYGCDNLETVAIPEGVMQIGDEAFLGCMMLSQIEIPSTVMYVGVSAFTDTGYLLNLEQEPFAIVGDGVLIHAGAMDMNIDAAEILPELIDAYGYVEDWDEDTRAQIEDMLGIPIENLAAQGELVIPEGVKYLGGRCVENMTLTRLVLPSTLEGGWGDMEPFYQVYVEEIYLSDGVYELPPYVFSTCFDVKRIRLPESITAFNRIDMAGGNNFTIIAPAGSDVYHTAQDFGYTVEAE